VHALEELEPLQNHRERREALRVQTRVVAEVDEHLTAARVGTRGGEGEGPPPVARNDRVVADLLVAELRVELRVACVMQQLAWQVRRACVGGVVAVRALVGVVVGGACRVCAVGRARESTDAT